MPDAKESQNKADGGYGNVEGLGKNKGETDGAGYGYSPVPDNEVSQKEKTGDGYYNAGEDLGENYEENETENKKGGYYAGDYM